MLPIRSRRLADALAVAASDFEAAEARTPALRRELALAEIASSMRLAGYRFTRAEVTALTERGITPHGRTLVACNALADYALASDYVASVSRTGRRRAWLEIGEVVALHALATQRLLGARPGRWRTGTLPVHGDGSVPPAPWTIPHDVARYVDRVALGPPRASEALAGWLADALADFERMAPFSGANGRVGRLVLGILLRRLRLPPLVIETTAQSRLFGDARVRASRGDRAPLERFLAATLVRTVEAAQATETTRSLVPLSSLAAVEERRALYKAFERGRLRAVRRGRNVFSTDAWVAEYRRSRSSAGRPRRIPLGASKCDPLSTANGET